MSCRFLACLACLALLSSGHAVAQVTIKDSKGCKLINPFLTSIDAVEVKWSGACKDGYISGPGTVTSIWSNETLEGDFVAGRASYGIFKERRGIYEGPLRDNAPFGWGTFKMERGFTLKAHFHYWSTSGRVEVLWPDGSSYFGEYDHQKDTVAGKGMLNYPDGSVYIGEFRSNQPEGEGAYRTPGGEIRSGTFAKGKQNGQGEVTYTNGDKYVGRLTNHKPSGQGTLEYAKGGKYEGGFLNGLQHGKGRFTHPNGTMLEGELKAGVLQVGTYNDGSRKFEINLKQGTFLEVLLDGSKLAVDPLQFPNLACDQ